ncbi:DUF6053 domain-containing protein [Lysobacter capsici]
MKYRAIRSNSVGPEGPPTKTSRTREVVLPIYRWLSQRWSH